MSETKRNKERVDQAWNKLYDRLDADGLLLSDRQNRKRLSASMLWKWGAVAAISVGLGVFLTTTYRKVGEPVEVRAFIMQENTEQSTLVTTLEDGSIVYMGGETSLQYPEHFSMDKREVSLQGNALFDEAGNRERPFLIETEEVRIEVLGTMFHVKSDVGSTFELSVQRGKVKVALKNKNQEMYVNAGEAVTLKTHQLRFTDYRDDTRIAHYWKSMRFKDESLMNILRGINMHSSGLQLKTSPSLGERRLTVAFSGESPESMAELICLAMNLKYAREGDIGVLSEFSGKMNLIRTYHYYWHIFFFSLLDCMAEFTKAADRDVLERVIYLAKSKGTVYTLLGKVSEQSGFLFVYDSKVVDNDRMVKLGAGQRTIRQAVYEIIGRQDISLRIVENHILINQLLGQFPFVNTS